MDALWMQNKPGGYAANLDRRLIAALLTEGVFGSGFAVTQRGAGSNMSVDVSAGEGVVTGDNTAGQGRYLLVEDEPVTNVSIGAAPGSGTRHDLIVARVNDGHAGGDPTNDAGYAVVPGVVSGEDPPTPATALVLARVRVAAGTVAITNAMIDDLRQPARLANEVVSNASIAAAVITAAKIADSAVITAKVADAAVTTAKIGDSQVTTAKIADAAITHDKIGASAVTNTKIGTNAVSETKIGASAVTNAKIAAAPGGTVDGGRISYARLGDMVFVWVSSSTGANSVSSGSGLPVGYRPASPGVLFPSSHYLTGASGSAGIATTGAISLPASGHTFVAIYRAAA